MGESFEGVESFEDVESFEAMESLGAREGVLWVVIIFRDGEGRRSSS